MEIGIEIKKATIQITKIFQHARDKLEGVEANARKMKKEIVVELAKSFEEKVAT